jgi:hypothetical protein
VSEGFKSQGGKVPPPDNAQAAGVGGSRFRNDELCRGLEILAKAIKEPKTDSAAPQARSDNQAKPFGDLVGVIPNVADSPNTAADLTTHFGHEPAKIAVRNRCRKPAFIQKLSKRIVVFGRANVWAAIC